MSAPSTTVLIETWEQGSASPPHRRLTALLQASCGAEPIIDDSLGARNRRLLQLHRDLVGGPIEGVVGCELCAARSEFVFPTDAILATPAPPPDARVRLRARGRTLSFRLPRMSDLEAVSHLADSDEIRNAIVARCALDPPHPVAELADRLGQRFEALDPAANVVLNIACSGCTAPIVASVDIATFVARDLDRIVDGLFRDIDVIAAAYGWSESAILDLNRSRRRRYAAMVAAARAPARPQLAWSRP